MYESANDIDAEPPAQGKIGKQSLLQMRNRNRFDEDIWWGQGNA